MEGGGWGDMGVVQGVGGGGVLWKRDIGSVTVLGGDRGRGGRRGGEGGVGGGLCGCRNGYVGGGVRGRPPSTVSRGETAIVEKRKVRDTEDGDSVRAEAFFSGRGGQRYLWRGVLVSSGGGGRAAILHLSRFLVTSVCPDPDGHVRCRSCRVLQWPKVSEVAPSMRRAPWEGRGDGRRERSGPKPFRTPSHNSYRNIERQTESHAPLAAA